MAKQYDHKKIEKKHQSAWSKSDIYHAKDNSKKEKFFPLVEFPFPSGAGLHTGHIRSYTALDIISRKRRMQGFNVLYPIGWDAFGLPTENYAIKTGIQPKIVTKQNTDTFRKQLKALGISFDWKREVNTTDPEYYKWTQWIFLKMYEKGLAYKSKMTINWCPKDKVGLANEEVIDGCCERCGTAVEKREKEQWMLAITKYADRLDKDLDTVNYIEQVKIQQKNWIGKSQGVNFKCKIKDLGIEVQMYNSVPQTYCAETFTVIAPEHPLVPQLVKGTSFEKSVLTLVEQIKKKKLDVTYDTEKEMEGIFTGRYIENFAGTGKDLPIWIASYVLADYGTGIVNASAHDTRDFAFAKKYNIPLHPVMIPQDEELAQKVMSCEEVCAKDPNATLLEPLQFKGRKWGEAREDIIDYLVEKGFAERKINYKLRDWIFSRQRYWGEPIPMIHCESCGWVAVPEKDLPVKLPAVKKYEPTDNGESPLALVPNWIKTKCPKCKGPGRRETDTMPNWAGSSWYYLRYTDPKNKKIFADKKKLEYWLPIDWYNGGMEHTTLHLLYSRFWHKFLYDIGYVPTSEPYQKRTSHGMILGEGGIKMSKSLGNVVNPDDIVSTYGADTLRVYEMFIGPFNQSVAWSTESIIGSRRFIERVWKLTEKVPKDKKYSNDALETVLHKTIKKVGEDIEVMGFNTAVSSMMIFVSAMEKESLVGREQFEQFLKILAPFAPHIAEELWSGFGNKKSIHVAEWPSFDPEKLVDDEIKIAVQVNGKVRAEFVASRTITGQEIEKRALTHHDIEKWILGKKVVKVIYVPQKLVNIVVV